MPLHDIIANRSEKLVDHWTSSVSGQRADNVRGRESSAVIERWPKTSDK